MLSPAIFAERHKINDPNDEPFLPIYPTYPYNPKLIKRGIERQLSQLTAESYKPPKEDARDSYSTSYSNNYQRDPNYNPYPKNTSPLPTYNPYYNEDPYGYINSPYTTYNSYPAPYAMSPAAYPVSSYPDYYFQPPYYYPHYYNHALFPPQPSSLSKGVDHATSQDSAEDDKQDKDEKSKKENETSQDAPASQFVDGGNYISGNTKDLDGQSSAYKTASPYNQLEQDEVQAKNLPIPLPKTTYRVISVAGQPVGPDYPLPAQYVKAQQVEQLMSQTLATLLAQKAQQQTGQTYENNRDTLSGADGGPSYVNQDNYNPNDPATYVAVPGVRTQTGVAYVINSDDDIAKANGEQVDLQVPQSRIISSKDAKYLNNPYLWKPATQPTAPSHPQTTLDHLPQATYVPQQKSRNKHRDRVINSRPADQADEYDPLQSYIASLSQVGNKRRHQNYDNYQGQASSYRNKDFVAAPQKPRAYSYQYSAYELDQAATAQKPQQPRQDNVNSGDGNFGAKQPNKGWRLTRRTYTRLRAIERWRLLYVRCKSPLLLFSTYNKLTRDLRHSSRFVVIVSCIRCSVNIY